MAKSKLDKILESRNEEQPLYTKSEYAGYTRDQLRQEIYNNRQQAGSDGGSSMLRSNTRAALLERAGTDWYNIDDIEPNPENNYSIDDKSIELLANLIFESNTTTPIFLIEADDGKLRIIDGERRYRAHKLLAELKGPEWKMIPGQLFRKDELADTDVNFMLNALNVGQREMTASERARGMAAVADRITLEKAINPDSNEGRVAHIVANQMGISPRMANMEINIGHNLIEEGMYLLDNSKITKVAADAMARLSPEQQRELAQMIEDGELEKEDVLAVVKQKSNKKSTSPRIPKSTDEHLKAARRALRKAAAANESPDRVLIAECRNFLDMIDPDKEV